MNTSGRIHLAELRHRLPETQRLIEWLEAEGIDPTPALESALSDLRKRNAYLETDRRLRYLRQVLLGFFFIRWLTKNKGRRFEPPVKTIRQVSDDDSRIFQLAMIALGDDRTFQKVMPRLAKQRQDSSVHAYHISAEGYASHVMNRATEIGDLLLDQFKLDRTKPERAVVSYLQTTTVSQYLQRTAQYVRRMPGLVAYLQGKSRLDDRTRMAAKLVDMPCLLTPDERRKLREKYGVKDAFTQRWKVKDVAELLGYPSPQTLSKRLYRLRKWAEKWQPEPLDFSPLVLIEDPSLTEIDYE